MNEQDKKPSNSGGRTDGGSRTRERPLTEADLAADKMGRNSLQGDDQARVRNQRHAVPDVKKETDSIEESAEKTDKDVRAQRDLGKGRRHSPDHPYNRDDN